MCKKRLRYIGCILWAIVLCVTFAIAHSGRTDSHGGHYDSSTGEYHYHHGYPAHQHENGICPYNFNDKTNRSSSSSSSNKSAVKGSSNTNHSKSRQWTTWELFSIVIGSSIGFYFIIILYGVAISSIESAKERKQFIEKQTEYRNKYKNKTKNKIAEECGMPSDTEIGFDGLPKVIGADGWGDKYTFYKSYNGYAVHHNPHCNHYSLEKVHAYYVRRFKPCSWCCPPLPDLEWYRKYLSIINLLEKYDIRISLGCSSKTASTRLCGTMILRAAQKKSEQEADTTK